MASKYNGCDGEEDMNKPVVPINPAYSRELVVAAGWLMRVVRGVDLEGKTTIEIRLGHPRLPQHSEMVIPLGKLNVGFDIDINTMMHTAMALSNEQR